MASVDLQEKANFTRLSRLLVDKGTEALRITFDTIHPPFSLFRVLAANRASLRRLKPRVINDTQWDLLFPLSGYPPDSTTFDVTLLTILFRNICGFPSTGWDVMPSDTDRSMQANIARIKLFRNEVYAHVKSTRVCTSTFESLWKKIAQALVELGIPQSDIDDVKSSSLGPGDEVYVTILKQWNFLEAIECSIDRLAQITLENRDKSDEDILRKLAKHNFKSKIQRKVKSFQPGTRMWLLKEVNEWFYRSDSDSSIKLITAGPGFGKSVFAAKICEDFEKSGKLAACHFCDFSDSNLRDPMMMLESLASQMCKSVPGFKEELLDQLKRHHQVQNLKDAFQIYLQNPLNEVKLCEPVLVMIDGLDESTAVDKNEIVNLIADCFPDLPKYVKILVTSRPEISVGGPIFFQKINIANDDVDNNLDLERYFKACLSGLFGDEIKSRNANSDERKSLLASAVVKRCQGSFLYAYHIQSELKARYDFETMTNDDVMKFLPGGLNSVYQRYFNRLEDEIKAIRHETFDVLKILEMLAASKGPLPLPFIAQSFGLAPDCRETKDIINKINETVSCLLYVSGDMLTVFHKSVIDWLLVKGCKDHPYAVKIDDGNTLLSLVCEMVFEVTVNRVCSGLEVNFTTDVKYALEYGLEHLEESNLEGCISWSVDVVIVYLMLTARRVSNIDKLFIFWSKILQSSLVKSEQQRSRISWHVVELDSLYRQVDMLKISRCYLEAILTYSPEGYFTDAEKKIAKSLLLNLSPLVEFNSYEVSLLPQAVWISSHVLCEKIADVALANNEECVAVGMKNSIHVISVPTLVEIMNYSTKLKRVSCCVFSPDDSLILFGKLETAFNIAERKEVPFFPGNEETFLSCAFSPNGKRLVTSDGSNIIKLWDVAKQRLLSSLCAEFPVDWCSFSITGLYIIGNSENKRKDAFCLWNSITLQRSDKRKLSEAKQEKPHDLKIRVCERCCRKEFGELCSKRLKIKRHKGRYIMWCSGICKGVECIFSSDEYDVSSAIEGIPLTAVIAWNNYVASHLRYSNQLIMMIVLGGNLWLYADTGKLIVFRVSTPTLAIRSLSHSIEVYSSSFSPDGSRLASCTSDGYIKLWNVYTNQVEQRFKSKHSGSRFLCWWSENFLFVFDFFCGIPTLMRYPVDDNLKILFTHSQQFPLCHLKNELEGVFKVADFSNGFLIFECRECTEPMKVLDVIGLDGPVMITLPHIQPKTEISISPNRAFILGSSSLIHIWRRNAEKPALCELIFSDEPIFRPKGCCFSQDSKIAVVRTHRRKRPMIGIYHLDTGHLQFSFPDGRSNPFMSCCVTKERVVIAVFRNLIAFLDLYSGTIIDCSFQPYLTGDLKKIKLSPKETMLAFPDLNGDMLFRRLCVSESPLLANIMRKNTFTWGRYARR